MITRTAWLHALGVEEVFTEALVTDVADIQGGTTSEGIHLEAMAGTVDVLQRCYTGLELRDNVLWLTPRLPKSLQRLRLFVRYRGQSLTVEVDRDSVDVRAMYCVPTVTRSTTSWPSSPRDTVVMFYLDLDRKERESTSGFART